MAPAKEVTVDLDDEQQHVASRSHLRGTRLVTITDGPASGMRVLEMYTTGIRIEVLLDRAGDIGRAEFRGVPFSWTSPVGYVPASRRGGRPAGFLRTFPGGLLATCGLEHIFGAESEPADGRNPHATRTDYPLHGSLSENAATLRGHGVTVTDGGPVVWCELEVEQVVFFGESLLLRRRIELDGAALEIRVDDTVTNTGPFPQEVMIDYHANFGYPLVAGGARVELARTHDGEPEHLRTVPGPLAESPETVQHDRIADGAPERLTLWSADGSWGVSQEATGDLIRYRVLWEYLQCGQYVLGLESASSSPEGRAVARDLGELSALEPGKSLSNAIRWTMLSR